MASLFSKPKTISNNAGDREYQLQLDQQNAAQAEKNSKSAADERLAQQKATGRASTILTSLNEEDQAPTAKRKLLGE